MLSGFCLKILNYYPFQKPNYLKILSKINREILIKK